MPKTKISEFDTNPDNNTDINSINIAEGCAPSGINNAIRQLMADLKEQQTGASGDSFTVGGALVASGTFAANGGVTLGDASGDALTINSSAVSIPNGLNFDSNTLVIDATNNRIGIGTASPSQRLHVASAGTVAIQAENTASSGSAYLNAKNTATTCAFGVDASGGYIETAGAYNTIFYTNSAERMRITSAGNVGIGTSSPTEKLQVDNGASNSYIRIVGQSSNFYIGQDGTGAALISDRNAPMYFSTNNTERMRLDASGNLGLGVTPSAWVAFKSIDVNTISSFASATNRLQVAYNSYYNGTNYIYKTTAEAARYDMISGQHQWHTAPSGTAGNAITFTQAMTLDASGNLLLGTTSSTYSAANRTTLEVYGSTDSVIAARSSSGASYIYNSSSGMDLFTTVNGYMRFLTNSTERMRIDSSGNVFVGTTGQINGATSKSVCLGGSINSFAGQCGNGAAVLNGGLTSTGGYFGYWNYYNGSTWNTVGTITTNGSTTAYNTSSDYRLKENIAPMTGALAKVAQLKPCTYTWKVDGSAGEGFIAHELAEVVPDAVSGEKDAVNDDGSIKPQGIDTSFLVATLTAAIQEQQAIINDLKARIETLESK